MAGHHRGLIYMIQLKTFQLCKTRPNALYLCVKTSSAQFQAARATVYNRTAAGPRKTCPHLNHVCNCTQVRFAQVCVNPCRQFNSRASSSQSQESFLFFPHQNLQPACHFARIDFSLITETTASHSFEL
jgi:hypothetical protein